MGNALFIGAVVVVLIIVITASNYCKDENGVICGDGNWAQQTQAEGGTVQAQYVEAQPQQQRSDQIVVALPVATEAGQGLGNIRVAEEVRP